MIRNIAFVTLALAALAACEPQDRRPGLWLWGEVAPAPEDWTFVNEAPEVLLETSTWYGIPHSVTVVIAEADGAVYVPSIYDEDLPFPGTKQWNANIERNPEVRLKVGETLYEMVATPAANRAERQAGLHALAKKYDFWRKVQDNPRDRPPFAIIRLAPR